MKRRGKKPNGRQVQAQHRGWNQQSLDARGDKQVLARLERLVASSPRPRPDESDVKWNRRAGRYVREFRAFFRQHATRLKRLGICIEDFGLLDPAKNVPDVSIEQADPRYLAAEEESILRDMAEKGVVKYTRLG